jgi:hypothetical protein
VRGCGLRNGFLVLSRRISCQWITALIRRLAFGHLMTKKIRSVITSEELPKPTQGLSRLRAACDARLGPTRCGQLDLVLHSAACQNHQHSQPARTDRAVKERAMTRRVRRIGAVLASISLAFVGTLFNAAASASAAPANVCYTDKSWELGENSSGNMMMVVWNKRQCLSPESVVDLLVLLERKHVTPPPIASPPGTPSTVQWVTVLQGRGMMCYTCQSRASSTWRFNNGPETLMACS